MIAQVYAWLESQIKLKLPELSYVDYFTGETDDDGNTARVHATPCVLIEFAPQQWTQGRQGVQETQLTFTTSIVTTELRQGKDRIQSQAGAHLQLAHRVYQALQSATVKLSEVPGLEALSGTAEDAVLLNTIERIESDTSHELSRYMVTRIVWRSLVRDYSMMPATRAALADLSLTARLGSLAA